MALTSCMPLKSGYLACNAAQPAGAAALAETGAQMPAKRNATSAALRNPASEVDRRARASVENRVCICFLLRRCHGLAMFQVRPEPMVFSRFQACLGAHKKLDRPVPGFRHGLRKLWATAVTSRPAPGRNKNKRRKVYPPKRGERTDPCGHQNRSNPIDLAGVSSPRGADLPGPSASAR